MKALDHSILFVSLALVLPACATQAEPWEDRIAEAECETADGELPPELDGEFDIINPTTGEHITTIKFTIDDAGRIWDAAGKEVFPVEEGCIENWSFEGTSEKGTPYQLDWNIEAGWWDVTNASGTPRAVVPQ